MLTALPCPWTVTGLLAIIKPIRQPTPIARTANTTLRMNLLPDVLNQEFHRRSYVYAFASQQPLYARHSWGSIPSFSLSSTFGELQTGHAPTLSPVGALTGVA